MRMSIDRRETTKTDACLPWKVKQEMDEMAKKSRTCLGTLRQTLALISRVKFPGASQNSKPQLEIRLNFFRCLFLKSRTLVPHLSETFKSSKLRARGYLGRQYGGRKSARQARQSHESSWSHRYIARCWGWAEVCRLTTSLYHI